MARDGLGDPAIELRAATVEEISRIYGGAEHIIGAVNGVAVAWISFRHIDGRLWGMFDMLTTAAPSVWLGLFYAFRRELHAKDEPVSVLARDVQASRLLRLLGLAPTTETYAGKRVWQWKPQHYS